MKEAIGSSWMLGLAVTFIVLFTSYLAVSINYTKAFKVKNEIINIIESNQGFTENINSDNFKNFTPDEFKNSKITEEKIYGYLQSIGYANTAITEADCSGRGLGKYGEGGYCVQKNQNGSGYTYKVTAFIKIELPIINFKILIPIGGETKTLYYVND